MDQVFFSFFFLTKRHYGLYSEPTLNIVAIRRLDSHNVKKPRLKKYWKQVVAQHKPYHHACWQWRRHIHVRVFLGTPWLEKKKNLYIIIIFFLFVYPLKKIRNSSVIIRNTLKLKKKKNCYRQTHQEKKKPNILKTETHGFSKKKLIGAGPANPFIPQPTLQILTKNPILLCPIPNHQWKK